MSGCLYISSCRRNFLSALNMCVQTRTSVRELVKLVILVTLAAVFAGCTTTDHEWFYSGPSVPPSANYQGKGQNIFQGTTLGRHGIKAFGFEINSNQVLFIGFSNQFGLRKGMSIHPPEFARIWVVPSTVASDTNAWNSGQILNGQVTVEWKWQRPVDFKFDLRSSESGDHLTGEFKQYKFRHFEPLLPVS